MAYAWTSHGNLSTTLQQTVQSLLCTLEYWVLSLIARTGDIAILWQNSADLACFFFWTLPYDSIFSLEFKYHLYF